MPPKLRALGKQALSLRDSLFYCPSCSTWRRSLTTTNNAVRRNLRPRRAASTLVSSSAVNARKNIPERFKELYEALNGVRDTAASHVNLSRLQLAQRGLESENPVIRLAVLGLDDAATTVRLVRLMLADPLGPREQWEDYLESYNADNSRGLLIRYGETPDLAVPNSLVPTISIPSTTLKKGNLEVLVSSLGIDSSSSHTPITSNALHIPTIAVQATSSGLHTMVRYPVHKSIVCGKGIDGLLTYTKLASSSSLANTNSTRAVFELGVSDLPGQTHNGVSFVNIGEAEAALSSFRESVQNAGIYEKGWSASGVQPLINWITARSKEDQLDPALKDLVGTVLSSASESVTEEESRRQKELESALPSAPTLDLLDAHVTSWAEEGHTELRDNLNEGFASQPWQNLSWWKLFWKVDDVGMITSSILREHWLPRAEKEVIWLGGKFHQAGILTERAIDSEQSSAESRAEEEEEEFDPRALWPTKVTKSRHQLIGSTVPALQSLAQKLVLYSVSTTTLTSALSALTYMSVSSTSLYEAGTVAAIGLIYSLRRQQKKWDAARGFWEREVRETGRQALKDTEEEFRSLIREGSRAPEKVEETEAREKIERARRALSNVK